MNYNSLCLEKMEQDLKEKVLGLEEEKETANKWFNMVRPRKHRKISFSPDIVYFKPAGVPMRDLEELQLEPEEVEALKLQNIDDLSQEDSAKKMRVSQPTFYRIIKSARRKVTDALINGKAIRINKK